MNLETDRSSYQPDRQVVRAARSLHVNREKRTLVEGRIGRAEEALRSFLDLAGLDSAVIGGFRVERAADGVKVTPITFSGATQISLPEVPPIVHTVREAQPISAYQSPPTPAHQRPGVDPAAQVSFLAPDEAAFMHELRQLAVRTAAIFEASRSKAPATDVETKFNSASQVYAYLRSAMADLPQEQLRVLTLTLQNELMGEHLLYQGTINATTLRVAEIFRPAIVDHAAQIIVVHNHPSGDPAPSSDDIAVTRQLTQAGDLFDIRVLDHVIVARRGYASMKDRGHIPPRR